MSRQRSSANMTMQSEIFITLVVVVLLLLLSALLMMQRVQVRQRDLEVQKQEFEEMRRLMEIQLQNLREKEQPPLIILDQASGYAFQSGSSEMSENFKRVFEDKIVPSIERVAAEYRCDVIEVYGFTDGQPHRYVDSSIAVPMDLQLAKALASKQTPVVRTRSNVELGLMRAVSVASFLRNLQDRGRLQGVAIIRPYSGGHLILPDGKLADPGETQPDDKRRRIELRLSRTRDLHSVPSEPKQSP